MNSKTQKPDFAQDARSGQPASEGSGSAVRQFLTAFAASLRPVWRVFSEDLTGRETRFSP